MDWIICKHCHEPKPLSEFNRRGKSHQSYCRDCQRLLKQRYYLDNRETCLEQRRLHRREHSAEVLEQNRLAYADLKGKARHALRYAVRKGQITKPTQCQQCLKPCSPRELHGHHPDYSCPLEVVWLCSRCHASRDSAKLPAKNSGCEIEQTNHAA